MQEVGYITTCNKSTTMNSLIPTSQQSKPGIRDQLVNNPAHHRQAQLMNLALVVKFVQALVDDNSSVNEAKTKHPKNDTHNEFSQNTGRSRIHKRFQAVIFENQIRFFKRK